MKIRVDINRFPIRWKAWSGRINREQYSDGSERFSNHIVRRDKKRGAVVIKQLFVREKRPFLPGVRVRKIDQNTRVLGPGKRKNLNGIGEIKVRKIKE